MAEPPHQAPLRELISRFADVRIAVLGDPMLDVYHFGRIDRLSPEAPVPVFIETSWEIRKGGAANVCANLTQLGARVAELAFPPGDQWTRKHRYLVGTHQVFRIDEDADSTELLEVDDIELPVDALVISDYGRGACQHKNCVRLIHWARDRAIPVVVDPKGSDWTKYHGATVICPNHLEYQERYRPSVDDSHIVLKRAAEGIDYIRSYTSERRNFPARARRVYDVTGAGDTVTAVLAATLAARGSIEQGCELANLAAGVVVGEVGTSTVTARALTEELDQ